MLNIILQIIVTENGNVILKNKIIWTYLLFNPPPHFMFATVCYTIIYLESFNNRNAQKLWKYYNQFISLDTVL